MSEKKLTKVEALPGEPSGFMPDYIGDQIAQTNGTVVLRIYVSGLGDDDAKRAAWETMAARLNVNADLLTLCEEMESELVGVCWADGRCPHCVSRANRLAEIKARLK